MARVDLDEVRALVSAGPPTDEQVEEIYIPAGSAIVDQLVGQGLSDETLKQVELFVIADLIVGGPNSVLTSQQIGDASESYNVKSGTHSHYWRTAVLLSNGLLDNINKPRAVLRVYA